MWQLTRDPNWRPGRYQDLTFDKDNQTTIKIITAGGNFVADGFEAGQKIAVMYSSNAGIDGIYDVLAVSGNTIEVGSGHSEAVRTIEELHGRVHQRSRLRKR